MTEPTLYPESGFRRLRIDLAYDGTNFSGWAIQPDRRTVQEVVETALSTVAQSPAPTIVAGRTDAGVHATGQVIHVDLPETLELEDLAYKLNRILDEDVRINTIEIAPTAFHARFSALRRYYEYRILDENRVIQPLARLNTAPWYRPLDVDVMNRASALLLRSEEQRLNSSH
jgi:tRNA pseudouridine38-40 synthase